MSLWRHLRAIVLLPGMAAVVVPAAIAWAGDDVEVRWATAVPGALLICAGVAMWAWTVVLFARIGRGTLAPWDPTSSLVVEGPYGHVRNPMITAVLAVLVGEAALLGSLPLLAWSALFLAANAVWFPLVEEPGLARRFGAEYEAYRSAVPRWIPRLRPWRPAKGLEGPADT